MHNNGLCLLTLLLCYISGLQLPSVQSALVLGADKINNVQFPIISDNPCFFCWWRLDGLPFSSWFWKSLCYLGGWSYLLPQNSSLDQSAKLSSYNPGSSIKKLLGKEQKRKELRTPPPYLLWSPLLWMAQAQGELFIYVIAPWHQGACTQP